MLCLGLGGLLLLPTLSYGAKIDLKPICPLLEGEWQGSAANPNGESKQVTTSVMCSADQLNLYISVSQGARFSNSETWWFRQRGANIGLVYSDGINTDVHQTFTLYQQDGSFTLLGKGEVKQRPALIRLSFEANEQNHWLWQQSAHFLDDDSDSYTVVRAIGLTPITQTLVK
ncbi:hypothetical protein HBH39_16410 [Shewanella aestuarii]|uniref:DUF1579 domain-containing protein n=2 Tax=Shewanella aestuarii TaxID=1028752 RepID=A0A6G9QR41_9GAMM|nr:hypothetical protein HBH39_16410 [Shewanella aestuarii]